MHLVQAHSLELLVVGLERIDDADGLTDDHADDDVGAEIADVLEDRLRGDRPSPWRCLRHRGVAGLDERAGDVAREVGLRLHGLRQPLAGGALGELV